VASLLTLLLLLLLLLVLMVACAPSRHRVRLASATDLPGKLESLDRGGASVVPKISSRASRVPGQSSQCSSVCGGWPHLGQLRSTVLSVSCFCCCCCCCCIIMTARRDDARRPARRHDDVAVVVADGVAVRLTVISSSTFKRKMKNILGRSLNI